MPRLTIKNIPDEIYRRLKAAAEGNHRSINGEVIACLDEALTLPNATAQEQLVHIRKLRESLRTKHFDTAQVLEAVDAGRR